MFKSRVIEGHLPGPHLLIFAGVHGDEYEPMAAARQVLQRVDPSALRGKLTLIAVANEGAFYRADRVAEDGLDLARTFPGKPGGTVTQRLAHELTKLINQADALIDLHTGGGAMALYPMTGYAMHRDSGVLAKQRAMAHAFNLPVIWGTTPELDGRSLSAARDAKVPAIYAEYGGGGGCDYQAAERYAQGCMNVMAQMGMLESSGIRSQVQHVVEDDRPQSGYLQAGHPAPVAGFFTPAVKLGQCIKQGEPIGTIYDQLGDQQTVVPALESGFVLCLRVRPVVAKNETLATLIDVSKSGIAQ